ncbi:hypothetical protein NESM_000486600 [Novymonas esmeraldas]|uniref:Uncharacterized protein n=1 Tax=Novymonas esmeraldas TaxID=1808958 RepID=A0AAW0EN77_9TRYP
MDAAIVKLRVCLGELLAHYPRVLRNVFEAEPSSSDEGQREPHAAPALADAVEGFLTELTRVLSIGLCDADLGLWSVLELLECVPGRMLAVAEAAGMDASAPASAVRPLLQHHQRYRFASQLVHVVRTTFPAVAHAVRARILLRLMLNQGCLLASLELLRLWCWAELLVFYASSASAASLGLLVQPDTDSDVWNGFMAAVAPVAGPPVAEIAAGAPKVTAQPFRLQLLVSRLDDGGSASRAYYAQVQSYVEGRQPTRPSALECCRAAATVTTPVSGASATARAAAAASHQRGSRAAEQLLLRVETLPVHHGGGSVASVAPSAKGSQQRGCPSAVSASSSSSAASSHAITLTSSSSLRSRRRRGSKKQRRRRPAHAATEAAVPDTGGGAPRALTVAEGHVIAAAVGASGVAEGAMSVADVTATPAPLSRHGSAVTLREDEAGDGAGKAAASSLSAAPSDVPAAMTPAAAAAAAVAPSVSHTVLSAPEEDVSPHRALSAVSSPTELADLQHRLWVCWVAITAQAEAQEYALLAMEDVDANLST